MHLSLSLHIVWPIYLVPCIIIVDSLIIIKRGTKQCLHGDRKSFLKAGLLII